MQSNFGGVTSKTAVRIWKQHALQLLGKKYFFAQPTVAITYNRWAVDKDYRRQVAEELGLTFTDRGFHHVPTTGGGSSFDGLRYRGRAAEMATLNRWRRFRRNADYRAMFDTEIIQLGERIFELSPALERFADKLGAAQRA